MAFDPKILDDLSRRLAEAVPDGLRHVQSDLEQNFRGILQGALSRMDLVTREEFDVQAALLARTREKLEFLIEQVEQMEAALKERGKE